MSLSGYSMTRCEGDLKGRALERHLLYHSGNGGENPNSFYCHHTLPSGAKASSRNVDGY